ASCLPPYLRPRPLHSFPTRRSSDLKRRLISAGHPFRVHPFGTTCTSTAVRCKLSTALNDIEAVSPFLPSPPMFRLHAARASALRSDEHTSELQSRENLVCRLLLEKK